MIEVLILAIAALLGVVSVYYPLPSISRRFTFLLNLQVTIMVVIALIASTQVDAFENGALYYQYLMRAIMVWLGLIAMSMLTLQLRGALQRRDSQNGYRSE